MHTIFGYMQTRARRITGLAVRWGIAIFGVAWVVSNIHLRDRIKVLDDNNLPHEVTLVRGTESSAEFEYVDPISGETRNVALDRVINGADAETVTLLDGRVVPLLGMRLTGHIDKAPVVEKLLVQSGPASGQFLTLNEVKEYRLRVPQPLVEVGAATMVKQADRGLLLAAMAVTPVTIVLTTIRWHQLLKALGISISWRRVFVLNMVGGFYNSFMLGSTGGDVLKAYYAAKQAPTHRIAAVMSVVVDRAIGLLTLVVLGGTMAAIQYLRSQNQSDAVSQLCLQVAVGAAVLIAAALAFSTFVYSRALRQLLQFNKMVARIPMQARVQRIVDVVRAYRKKPLLILGAMLITFPVHIVVVVSAMLAGTAFDLPISLPYYFTLVPVVVLVAALPLSPQGAGVMEAAAYFLSSPQGATVNQALALTMSIRFATMIWNLFGGIFVLRGGYHAPADSDPLLTIPLVNEEVASQP